MDQHPRAPRIVELPARRYAFLRRTVTMTSMSEIADRLPEVIGAVLAAGMPPTGAPFLKYDVVDMDHELEVEAGIPISGAPTPGDLGSGVRVAELPAGRYVTAVHVGHPDGLVAATARLLDWAAARDLHWHMTVRGTQQHWACRLENYLTDPREEPDMHAWKTELAFKLA